MYSVRVGQDSAPEDGQLPPPTVQQERRPGGRGASAERPV